MYSMYLVSDPFSPIFLPQGAERARVDRIRFLVRSLPEAVVGATDSNSLPIRIAL